MHQYYPSLLLRQGLLMQAIASVVLFTFTWLLVHPALLAAQTQDPRLSPIQQLSPGEDAEFAEALAKIEAKLTTLRDKLARAENTRPEEEDLTQWRKRLMHLDARARRTFDRMEQHLQAKGVPEEILSRHQAMVTTYETELKTLLRNLDALAATGSAATRQAKATQTLQQLQTKQQRSKSRRFDPNHLPFRVPDGKVRKPKETKEEFQSALFEPQSVMVAAADMLPGLLVGAPAAALPALPTPDDLAPTEDVQITDEIRALAASLDHNPVKIYNWVHDNLEFLPTYGSIQGSHMALQTKRGNAFDTASLLIALLRAANIPARYGYGTVQIPMAKVMNWVGGVTHPEAALQVLGQGGIPNIGLIQGGALTAVKLEHMWVEAWVDFEPSRGAVHREGDTWVPLDASFKQYQYTAGMDLQGNVPFDSQTFVQQLTASAQVNSEEGWVSGLNRTLIQSTLATYQNQIDAYVTVHKPTATVGDVLGTKSIVQAQRPVLARGLPYQLMVRGNVWTQIPESLRHKFQFQLYTTVLDRLLDTPIVDFTQSLPLLADQKITLSFVPASQADADLITSYLPTPPADGSPIDPSAFPTSLPGYLIQLMVELRVEGQVVVSAGPFTMGQELVSVQGLYDPLKGWQEDENAAVAGEYQAFAIDTASIAGSQGQTLQNRLATTQAKLNVSNLTGITKEELIGDLLYNAVLSYLAANDLAERSHAPLAGIVTYRLPSFGRFTLVAQPHLVFGIPQRVAFPGLEMDMDHLVSLVVSRDNNHDAQVAYVWQSGLRQSALEHLIPERLFTDAQHPGEAVSAVKALAIANQEGQQLYTITQDNVAAVLSQLTIAPDVKTEIQEAIATGKLATVSQRAVTVGGWTGVGYIILDPETGSGAYKISGGANGSFFLGFALAAVLTAMTAAALASNPVLFFAALGVGLVYLFADTAYGFDIINMTEYDWACFRQGAGAMLALAGLIAAVLAVLQVATIAVPVALALSFAVWNALERFSFFAQTALDVCLRPE